MVDENPMKPVADTNTGAPERNGVAPDLKAAEDVADGGATYDGCEFQAQPSVGEGLSPEPLSTPGTTVPRPEFAAPEDSDQAREELDARARADGFVDDQAKKESAAAAAKKPRKPRAAKAQAPQALKVAADGVEKARALWRDGKGIDLAIGFGDAKGVHADIPAQAMAARMRAGKLVSGGVVPLRTAALPGTTQITHAWLIAGSEILAASELAAPITVRPGEQVVFRAGALVF